MTMNKVKDMFKSAMAKVKKGWQIFLGMVLIFNDWYEHTRETNEKVMFSVMILATLIGIILFPIDYMIVTIGVFGLLRGYGLVAKDK